MVEPRLVDLDPFQPLSGGVARLRGLERDDAVEDRLRITLEVGGAVFVQPRTGDAAAEALVAEAGCRRHVDRQMVERLVRCRRRPCCGGPR